MPAAGTICRFMWPLEVSLGVNDDIRVTVDGVTETLTIAPNTYWMLGDGTTYDFVKALIAALNTHSKDPTFTITIGTDGKLTLVLWALAWTIHWGNAETSFDGSWVGFTNADDAVGVLNSGNYRLTSTYQCAYMWNPERQYSDDTGIKQNNLISRSIDLSGMPTTYRWSSTLYREIFLDIIPSTKIFTADSPTNQGFDIFYDYLSTGGDFLWMPSTASPTVWTSWLISDSAWLEAWPVVQMAELSRYYQIKFPMILTTSLAEASHQGEATQE